jgi:hypothetical protein
VIESSFLIENMSHLTSSFSILEGEEFNSELHASQVNKKRIKLMLFFLIPPIEFSPEADSDLFSMMPRIASVRVPRGVPVSKLRNLTKFIEAQLHDIYGRSKRLNFVMTASEFDDNWSYEFDIPTFGVIYV